MPYNYIQQPRTQGQGFYNPYMPGPDIGQGVPQLMQQLMQIQMYQQERKKEMEKFWLEYEQKQKRDEAYIKRQEALTKKAEQEPTVKKWEYISALADAWYKQKLLSDKEYKTFKLTGKLPPSLERIMKEAEARAKGAGTGKFAPPKSKEIKPPKTQTSLVSSLFTKLNKAKLDIGKKWDAVTYDPNTRTAIVDEEKIMKELGGLLPPAYVVLQNINGIIAKFENIITSRPLSQAELKQMTLLNSLLADYKTETDKVLKRHPDWTAQQLIEKLLEFLHLE